MAGQGGGTLRCCAASPLQSRCAAGAAPPSRPPRLRHKALDYPVEPHAAVVKRLAGGLAHAPLAGAEAPEVGAGLGGLAFVQFYHQPPRAQRRGRVKRRRAAARPGGVAAVGLQQQLALLRVKL